MCVKVRASMRDNKGGYIGKMNIFIQLVILYYTFILLFNFKYILYFYIICNIKINTNQQSNMSNNQYSNKFMIMNMNYSYNYSNMSIYNILYFKSYNFLYFNVIVIFILNHYIVKKYVQCNMNKHNYSITNYSYNQGNTSNYSLNSCFSYNASQSKYYKMQLWPT